MTLEELEKRVKVLEDIEEIMKYGIMATPALVVDEKVEIKGRVPSIDEIKKILNHKKGNRIK